MAIIIGNKTLFGDYKVIIRNISFDEFLEFANEDISCELLDGVLIINSPAGYRHQAISRFLITYLDQFGLKTGYGRALNAPFIVKLDPKWGPEPDLIFYKSSKESLIKDTYFDGLPDLIIEILSPTNRDDDLDKKLPKYLSIGIPEVWIIDPESRELIFYEGNKSKTVYSRPDDVIVSKVIPNLHVRLKWLWDDKLDPLVCLKEFLD